MGEEKLTQLFSGRRLVIATKHGKEQILAPIFQEALGIEVIVPDNLDTDLLGTFSGEVERTNDPLTTARKKCEMALELSGADLAISSEGSFGAHPTAFFLPANEEWLLLLDQKNNLEIHARHLSTDTNFDSREFQNLEQLNEFAQKVGFPSHALILRNEKEGKSEILKGITMQNELELLAEKLLKKYEKAYVETDMRAHLNPTRMKVIEDTAWKLLKKIQSCCPACELPGFAVVSSQPGLPCSWCGSPTRSIQSQVKTCIACGHSVETLNPFGKTHEDPMYCDRCNP